MIKFLQHNKIFLSLYILFLIGGAFILFEYEKGDEILYANDLHTPFLNQFFKWTTHFAEWPILLFMLIVAIRFSYGRGLLLLVNNTIVLVVTQFLKHIVFPDQNRPSVFFENKLLLNFVEGMEINRYNSFPSGHTAGAFAFFFMLSILVKDKRWSPVFFTAALLVGVSRVYLMQHFFRDVYAGSLVAVSITSVFYLTFVQSGYYNNLHWREHSLYHHWKNKKQRNQ